MLGSGGVIGPSGVARCSTVVVTVWLVAAVAAMLDPDVRERLNPLQVPPHPLMSASRAAVAAAEEVHLCGIQHEVGRIHTV